MCTGTNCNCGCASADGVNYNPEEIKNAINVNLYESSGLESEVGDMYVKTMMFFEKNDITPSAYAVASNKEYLEGLKSITIDDLAANFEHSDEVAKDSGEKKREKWLRIIAIGIAIYFVFKVAFKNNE